MRPRSLRPARTRASSAYGTCMQFIEKNSFGLRSAVYHLKSDRGGLEFVLFPMIHVGSKEFYAEISRRLAACDLILAEGVDSRKVRLLTLSYSVVKRIRRMDLVTQREAMNISGLRSKVVKADVEGRAFDEQFSSIPLRSRLRLYLLLPAAALYLLLFGTREKLAENLALDDLPSRDEIFLNDEHTENLDAVLIGERDRQLIARIQNLYETGGREEKLVGVLFGAAHMRNVTRFLLGKLGYRVVKAEWVTVFDF